MLPRLLSFVLVPLLLATGLPATWSIILIDTRTGEIGVASATCLTSIDLRKETPVLVVGTGAATAQALLQPSGTNRMLIFQELKQGTDPAVILQLLAAQDPGHQSRQYGIVDVQGRAVTFSGAGNSQWAGGVTGQIGTIHYAIQGNILTGAPVVQAAELAVRNAAGDLPDKLMAGMKAAKLMGGDGRCSCSLSQPTSCGSPPSSFQKSAHVGYLLVSRLGDANGICGPQGNCASGSYHIEINIANQSVSSPDPVDQIEALFNVWRNNLIGVPDHHTSVVTIDPPTLPADGVTRARVTVVLKDWTGAPIGHGGATLTPVVGPGSTTQGQFGRVTDHGDGSYSFDVRAAASPGTMEVLVRVRDGLQSLALAPVREVPMVADPLWASDGTLDAVGGDSVTFVMRGGSARAGRGYWLAASGSGSQPGVTVGGTAVPLNPDVVTAVAWDLAWSGVLPGFLGVLDGSGRAQTSLTAPPGMLNPLRGMDLTFVFGVVRPLDFASNPTLIGVR